MRYEQIKPLLDEQVLDEVKMSPSALQKFANSPEAEGMLMGIEFEMCVPNVSVDDDSGEGEYDYDMDERAYSIDDIIEFFRNGEMSNLSSSGAQRLRNEMYDQYYEWTMDKISDNLDQDELNDRVRDRLRDDLDVNDYMDDAAEELGIDPTDNDENEQKVRERAEELLDDAVDELMGDSRDYERAYDDIRQEMEDEMRNDSDYDEESWLRDLGVDYMSEAEREWGLDWPHWRSYESEGEIDVDTVGDEFGRAMGLEFVNTSSNYHGARRDGKNWIIEPDSSIDAEQGDGGLEFVSPPMPLKDGLEMIQKMYKWAKDNGCYTNRSTGLHMNISVPDMTIEKLDYVKLALFLGDEYVLKQFGREYNSYCKSAMSKIKDRIRPEEVPQVLAQMKQHLNSLASKTIHSGITDKYTSINTKSNYVEFRGPGGDYLDQNPFEIINTALRLSMSLRIATDPEAYKQEYAKKLYKLVEQEKDPDESVKLFSQYALGELPKEDLFARLKFARKGRELEKTKKDPVNRLSQDADVRRKLDNMPEKWRSLLRDPSTSSDQELQSLINNLNSGEYDDEIDPDTEVPLAVAIIESELAWRQQQGELKSYWVMNKDGSGGKQMVFANNENEAILKGGKQLGMKREEAIVKLRAEEKTEPMNLDDMTEEEYNRQRRELPTFTLEKFVADIKVKERSSLEKALDTVKRRGLTGEVSATNYEFLQAVIERELRRRDEEGETEDFKGYGKRTVYPRHFQDTIAALPDPFNSWVMIIPSNTRDILVRAKLKLHDGDYDNELTFAQREFLISLIDDELGYRSTHDVDAMERGGELQFQPGTPMQVGTPEPADAEELFNTLPDSWKTWLADSLQHLNPATIQSVIDNLANGTGQASHLNIEQRDLVISRAQAELRSRRSTQSSREVFDSLPESWQTWLQRVGSHDEETLSRAIDNAVHGSNAAVRDLSDEQRVFIKNACEQELRRRQSNPVALSPGEEWPRPWKQWIDRLWSQDEANMRNVRASMADPSMTNTTLNADQREEIIRIIDDEFRRRLASSIEQGEQARAAQQAELVNRDDPVSSNDPEAEVADYEVYNPETGQVISVAPGATLDYAVSKARSQEQDLGLEAGTLQVRRRGGTNESINAIRKLAGLK